MRAPVALVQEMDAVCRVAKDVGEVIVWRVVCKKGHDHSFAVLEDRVEDRDFVPSKCMGVLHVQRHVQITRRSSAQNEKLAMIVVSRRSLCSGWMGRSREIPL